MKTGSDKPTILIADDDETIRSLLSEIVGDQGYIFDVACDGSEALEFIRRKNYDIVITDLQMPGASGIDVLRGAKERCQTTEVVILTGFTSEEAAINAVRLGAFDYLKKPLMDIDRIPRTILEIRKKQKKLIEKERTVQHLKKKTQNLSALKSELEEIAITDPLTGLYNRRYFTDHLREHFQKAKMFGAYFSLLMVDLDDFKRVNDTYGHPIGDLILTEAAVLLKTSVRTGDIVSRFGGDEFVILLKNTDREIAAQIAERIRQRFESHVVIARTDAIRFTASIGVCSFPETEADDESELLEQVDRAMYRGKRRGKNAVELHPSPVDRPETDAPGPPPVL
jgi:two-component system cell cycle response regulator